MRRRVSWQIASIFVAVFGSLCASLFPFGGALRTTRAQMSVVRDTPPDEYQVLSGRDWLAGHGVDVFYYSSPNHPAVLTRDGTYMYECVELAISLYTRLGYKTWKANGSMIQTAAQMITATLTHPPGFEDMEYYPNGDFTPPRPGDIVVWDSDYNDGTGHVGVVNRVAGRQVEVVQQNMWQGLWQRYRITLNLDRDDQLRYTLTSRDASMPAGWIRSPRMMQFIAQPKQRPLLNTTRSEWNRDGDTIYVYLSPRLTRVLADEKLFAAQSDEEEGTTPLIDLARALEHAGAFDLTDPAYAQRVLRFAMLRMRKDERLSPAQGVRSVDVMMKYTGDSVWLRPKGGTANGTWFRYDGLRDYVESRAW